MFRVFHFLWDNWSSTFWKHPEDSTLFSKRQRICVLICTVCWEDSEGGEKTFSSQGWDFCIISKRRSLESIPGSLPVESSNAALRYYLCLSLPPTNLSAHLRCWGEAACRSDVPVCKMVTSICCSEELVSHAAELTSLWEHSWVQDVQNSHPLKCLLRKRSDLPSQ